MNFPIPPNLRWPIVALSTVCLGFPLGRIVRGLLIAPNQPTPIAQTASGKTSPAQTAFPQKASDNTSDEAVEAEVARLIGNPSTLAGTRSSTQILDAISAAAKEPSDLKRFQAIYEAVSELGRNDLADALKRAREENNPIAIRALERRWAEVDPQGAAKLWAESGGNTKLSDAFFSSWAKLSPNAALTWLASLENGDQKNEVRNSVLNGVAKSDPQHAIDFANQMPEGADRSDLVTKAINALAVKDPAVALGAARALPEGASRKAAFDTVLTSLAGTNLEEAQRVIAELPPNTISSAANAVAAALAKKDPTAALAWADTLPEGTSKASAYSALASSWATKDVEAAAQWLDKLPAGASRDSAVAAFAARTAPRDPEGATAWASTLPSGDTRNNALQRTLSIWQRTNAQAAANWIATAPGLSDEERANLTKAAQQPPDPRRFRNFQRPPAGQ